jgi:hypothetical protein
MDEKLKFIPIEPHVVLEYINKKSKLTNHQRADIALRIISGTKWEVVSEYFAPICNELLIQMQQDWRDSKKPVNDDGPLEAA